MHCKDQQCNAELGNVIFICIRYIDKKIWLFVCEKSEREQLGHVRNFFKSFFPNKQTNSSYFGDFNEHGKLSFIPFSYVE